MADSLAIWKTYPLLSSPLTDLIGSEVLEECGSQLGLLSLRNIAIT